MSHIPQRQEKDCLNCGTIVQGRYCHVCGQENVVPKETFWHMVTHFFSDITHFDSRFFVTAKDLLLKPGFLSKEYMLGRKRKYLHPIQMYMFTSAIFFLLFFSVFKPAGNIHIGNNQEASKETRKEYIALLEKRMQADRSDIVLQSRLAAAMDTTHPLSAEDLLEEEVRSDSNIEVISFGRNYHSQKEYDSIQHALPLSERDGWLDRRFAERKIEISNEIRKNPKEAFNKIGENLLHRLPYMLFISLPLFALILKLVYIRRKQFYYADHGVFTLHIYIFSFLLLLLVFSFTGLRELTGWNIFTVLTGILFIGLFVYLYKAMRKFYGQGRAKTMFKFLLVLVSSLTMLFILFIFFTLFTAFTI